MGVGDGVGVGLGVEVGLGDGLGVGVGEGVGLGLEDGLAIGTSSAFDGCMQVKETSSKLTRINAKSIKPNLS